MTRTAKPAQPPVKRYFEDFRVGEGIEVGSHTLSQDEIIAFARQFDPQPFHTDPDAAKDSFFGGLIASGWHTVGLFMRMLVETVLNRSHSLGSPGVEDLRWTAPVRPGDTIAGRIAATEVRRSQSRPQMGIVRWRGELRNQRNEVVLTMVGTNMFAVRDAAQPSG